MEMNQAWTVLCHGNRSMIPYIEQLLTLVFSEIPEIKSQVCSVLSRYLAKSGRDSISYTCLARNTNMLKKVCMMHLSTVTSHNDAYSSVLVARNWALKSCNTWIMPSPSGRHFECAYQAKIAPLTHMTTPQTLYNDAEDHRRQIENGWAHSWKMNHEHGDVMATF